MNYRIKVLAFKPAGDITYLQVRADGNVDKVLSKYNNGSGVFGELRLDDGRRITSEQRKKIYATFGDIAEWTGDLPEYMKEYLKFTFCAETGQDYFSLSDCSVTTAREFINHVIEFVIRNGIPLQNMAIERTDDIDRYLYCCLKYKKCCICGRDGEIHHVDTIGMGNDRREVDDSKHKKMCLCREHHSQAHSMGRVVFFDRYKVYGIIFTEEEGESP